jgi:hypothetical protein
MMFCTVSFSFEGTEMSAKVPLESQTESRPTERVAAPPSQAAKTKRLSPVYALAWLHLMPKSAFPIRSRDDLAAKISALLLRSAPSEAEEVGHNLPAGTQQPIRKE